MADSPSDLVSLVSAALGGASPTNAGFVGGVPGQEVWVVMQSYQRYNDEYQEIEDGGYALKVFFDKAAAHAAATALTKAWIAEEDPSDWEESLEEIVMFYVEAVTVGA